MKNGGEEIFNEMKKNVEADDGGKKNCCVNTNNRREEILGNKRSKIM
jgi:hypothetical protein